MQLRHVVRSLVRHHNVDVLVARRHDQAYVERFDTARLLRVPIPDAAFDAQVEAFRRALRRQLEGAEYDVVHVRDGWAGLAALELRARLGYALVFDAARSPMSEPVLSDVATAAELGRAEEACVRRADLVIAPSELSRAYLAGLGDPAKVHVAPPGVDVDAFDWDEPPPAGPPRLLYLGSLTPGRGVRVLLRAMLDVAQRSNAVLVLAGGATPAFRDSLAAAIRDLDLEDRVELPGPIAYEDVPAEIARATVCVAPGAVELNPSGTALYPTKLLEYMACQRAVVAPRRGTVTMMMRDGQHGLLFEPGQPADLAAKILLLLQDSALRDRVGRAGYDLARRVHTASATRRQLRRAYGWLLSQPLLRDRFESRRALSEVDLPMPTSVFNGDIAAAPEGSRPPGRAITAFDGDTLLLDDTGARHLDGDDVTKVETNPIAASAEYLAEEEAEDRRREVGQWAAPAEQRDGGSMDSSFVAGEVEVTAPRPEHTELATAETPVVTSDDADTGEAVVDGAPSEVDTAVVIAQEDAPSPGQAGARSRARASSPPPSPRRPRPSDTEEMADVKTAATEAPRRRPRPRKTAPPPAKGPGSGRAARDQPADDGKTPVATGSGDKGSSQAKKSDAARPGRPPDSR